MASILLPSSYDTPAATFDSLALLQRRKGARSVRFFPKVSTKKTISRHSLTHEERCSYWLQDYEFLMIKQRNLVIKKQIRYQDRNQMKIKQLDGLGQCLLDYAANGSVHVHYQHSNNNKHSNDNNSNESSLCMRGLEGGLELVALRKKSFRFGALEEVFIEQETQYLGDYYDDEAIAYAYNSISNECQFLAERIALQDRKEIEDYIMYDDDDVVDDDCEDI
ncbi:hypothetical protein FRACYDRAFT_241026 [Fragilariopsis cylindrus CCMP1102]|uniref:Uncharacterized protein n=1 Tax=Fragilariopsis cylindrus CCMP1102 TaxID=635003 RepID=A0A1E7F8H7_9STRA|nr:hypothetical protein FRACYDRAFT_241026 [Fragilariopsis cylindrus CCMP1102]|eukprot:OEU14481.1 hypothetical protein FRACYDRAFT_241026 [Fragilariopsis cylindrus CCMP1102]